MSGRERSGAAVADDEHQGQAALQSVDVGELVVLVILAGRFDGANECVVDAFAWHWAPFIINGIINLTGL
jgi:hypothetical protein